LRSLTRYYCANLPANCQRDPISRSLRKPPSSFQPPKQPPNRLSTLPSTPSIPPFRRIGHNSSSFAVFRCRFAWLPPLPRPEPNSHVTVAPRVFVRPLRAILRFWVLRCLLVANSEFHSVLPHSSVISGPFLRVVAPPCRASNFQSACTTASRSGRPWVGWCPYLWTTV